MLDQYKQVAEFHSAFSHPVGSSPCALTKERALLRAEWLQSEVEELISAANIYEQADAFIDIIYFSLGGLVEMGLEPNKLFQLVHDANMKKLWEDGRPHYRSDGKVAKPPGWVDPMDSLKAEIDKLPSSRNYPLIEAHDPLCVAACIEMTLRLGGFFEVPNQETIGLSLGIEKDSASLLNLGIKIDVDRMKESSVLGPYITKAEYVRANTFPEWEFESKCRDALASGLHVICTLSAGRLYGTDEEDRGHAVVVQAVRGNRVEVVDPGPGMVGKRWESSEDLYIAARAREGGLIILGLAKSVA